MADLHPEILETPVMPEAQVENAQSPFEKEEAAEAVEAAKAEFLEEAPTEVPPVAVVELSPASVAPAPVVVQKDQVLLEVEKILEEELGEIYGKLPVEVQPVFKQKGEEASAEIAVMVRNLSLKVKRALELIRKWLLTIPHVNKFFLEQQAKIKVDKIQFLIDARKEDSSKRP